MPKEHNFVKIIRSYNRPMSSAEVRTIDAHKRGKYRSPVLVAQALYTLTQAGKLTRLARGKYMLPHWECIQPGQFRVDNDRIWDSVMQRHFFFK